MKNKAIGIFDSGIGGLTVFKEVENLLKHENLIYLGDTARVPYGIKSKATIERFALEDVKFLLEFDVKMIVAACNTVSALAMDYLADRIDRTLINVIDPAVEEALRTTQMGRIGILGTHSTIKSEAYIRKIHKSPLFRSSIQVYCAACPLFVPLVEEGWLDEPETYSIARRYLSSLIENKVDTVILGCTHYPLLKHVLQKILGQDVCLIDSAQATARVIASSLQKNNLNSSDPVPNKKFFVTDDPEKFKSMGQGFLGRNMNCVEWVSLTFEEGIIHDR